MVLYQNGQQFRPSCYAQAGSLAPGKNHTKVSSTATCNDRKMGITKILIERSGLSLFACNVRI